MKKEQDSHSAIERFEVLQNAAVDLISTHDLPKILELILQRACKLLLCDAGSIYVKQATNELVFEATFNSGLASNFQKRILSTKENRGLAVYCYNQKSTLNIADVYKLSEDLPYKFDQSFDQKTGYRTKSVLVQPLLSRRGEVIGVLQLINRKSKNSDNWPSADPVLVETMPNFCTEDEGIMKSFSALATAALENAMLYENIEKLFEGFVNASVKAIEARDPTTSGHSERVAILSVELAEKLNRSETMKFKPEPFSATQIRELRFASLLHDFGKIGVNETVLQKSKKLNPQQLDAIKSRIAEFANAYEIAQLRKSLDRAAKNELCPVELFRAEREIKEYKCELQDCWHAIENLNEPTVLTEDLNHKLEKIKTLKFLGTDKTLQALLEEHELFGLSIPQGSLSESERREIEMHVTHTFMFLKDIPWTGGLEALPEIAYAHHEKLDGSGYPRKLDSKQIPLQSQLMSICDIFDALVAKDRPYKKALPTERALDIISRDVTRGKLNADLFKIFIEGQVYKCTESHKSNSKKAA